MLKRVNQFDNEKAAYHQSAEENALQSIDTEKTRLEYLI